MEPLGKVERPPEHMSRWVRNERLYAVLIAQGLVVYAIPSSVCEDGIEFLLVSTDLIDLSQPNLIALCGVVPPVKGLKIADVVAPALGHGDNVVDFPPIVR
jgi:hypothetical protein